MRYYPIHWQYSQLVVRWYIVTTYDLPGIKYDTKKYYVQEEWNVTKSGHQYTPSRVYAMYQKYNMV